MKYLRLSLLTFLTGCAIFVTISAVRQPTELAQHAAQATVTSESTATTDATSLLADHYTGGFSLNDGPKVLNAHRLGGQIGFFYGDQATDPEVKAALTTLHMGAVDGYISSMLYYLECHREKADFPQHSGPLWCARDFYPDMTEDTFLSLVQSRLEELKDLSYIKGYWVLDDQPAWDIGYAKGLLATVHEMIAATTPGRPAVCGFGGFINANAKGSWNPAIATAFSSSYCDMVAFYIYSNSYPSASPPGADAFDWSMQSIVPDMMTALKAQGWNQDKQPLIGIAQTWAGPRRDLAGKYTETLPSSANLKQQYLSFCRDFHAQGVIGYSWQDGSVEGFPDTNATLAEGVKEGNQACQDYWNSLPKITTVRPACVGARSVATVSWSAMPGAETYTIDWWATVDGNYEERQITGIRGAAVRIPEGTPGTPGTPGGFAENVRVGVAVKAQTPLVSEFSPAYTFTTKTCRQT
jgi:hypothetical protein